MSSVQRRNYLPQRLKGRQGKNQRTIFFACLASWRDKFILSWEGDLMKNKMRNKEVAWNCCCRCAGSCRMRGKSEQFMVQQPNEQKPQTITFR